MASFFGEVLESSSRAYDGYCEDISPQNDPVGTASSYELSWREHDEPTERALFIILDGKCALGLSESLRCQGSLVAVISETKRREDEPLRETPESPSYIYRLSNGVYVCEVSPDMKLVNANYFSCKLHGFLKKSKEVLIIASRTSHGYFSSHCDTLPFIRGLSNSTFVTNGGKLLSPLVDKCNIVTGVPASVLIWCSLMKISASIYICYNAKEEMDSVLWKLFVDLLSSLWPVKDFICKMTFKEKYAVNNTGNLYI